MYAGNGIFGVILGEDVIPTSCARGKSYLWDSTRGGCQVRYVCALGNGICGVRKGEFQVGETDGHFRRRSAAGREVSDALGTRAAEPGPPIASYMEDKTAVNA